MKTRKSILLLAPLLVAALTGCQSASSSSSSATPSSSSGGTSSSDASSASSSSAKSYISIDTSTDVTVNMAVGYQPSKMATNMKFISGYGALQGRTSYTAVDGKTYVDGDFKPVWAQLQRNLNFTINDVTGTADATVAKLYESLRSTGFHYGSSGPLVNILVGNVDDIVVDGNAGTILDLADYLEYMPNFDAFLDENPAVKQVIMADPANESGIYYAPYFDGFDDLEKTLLLRSDWVEMLLDGEYTVADYDTAKTVSTVYTTFNGDKVDCTIDVVKDSAVTQVTKKHDTSIITTQNNLTAKNGATLVKALRDYIDDTYGDYYGTKRSRLFVGGQAAYDMDELVALYRCVLTNPGYLTGDATKNLVPLYPRESTANRYADLWRMMQFFGARGVESRNGYFYVDEDGNLADARTSDETIAAVKKMREMYQEGLILKDFGTTGASSGGKGKYNTDLLQGDLGFSTYDYVQTQTIYNANSTCAALNDGKFSFVPTMPAAYDWDDNGKQYHYTESWRSVKPNGWCITAATADDNAALLRSLKIFDYLYSEEGNKLMSYGPDAWIDGTTTYMGEQVPKLSSGALSELSTLASGNYTNYYRYFVGGTFPIGYVKEQGMEYQCTSEIAQPYLNEVENCIALGTLKHVNHNTDNTDTMLDIVPATLAYNQTESSVVDAMTEMSVVFGVESSSAYNIWRTIVVEGWDSSTVSSFTTNSYNLSESNYVNCVTSTLQVGSLVKYANDAYARMGMNPSHQ